MKEFQAKLNDLSLSKKIILIHVLMVCGIVSTLLYMLTVVIGAIIWEDYSSFSQIVSELIAIDAPSAFIVIPLFMIYSLLVFMFGIGILLFKEAKKYFVWQPSSSF